MILGPILFPIRRWVASLALQFAPQGILGLPMLEGESAAASCPLLASC